jgi:hypothetical protein
VTPKAVLYAFVISFGACFLFWVLSPSLDRLRERWRERTANSPLTPETEASVLKQLRMQEASLKRLERFRARPIDRLLYMMQLLSAGLLMFALTVLTVYLYPDKGSASGSIIVACRYVPSLVPNRSH